MPSQFDTLVEELRVGQAVAALPPDRRQAIEAMIGKPPELAKAVPFTPLRPVAGREITAPKRPERPITMAELAKATQAVVAATEATSRATRSAHRAFIREQARDNARRILAKALELFHDGELTGHQVAVIQARAHAIDDAAARAGSSR